MPRNPAPNVLAGLLALFMTSCVFAQPPSPPFASTSSQVDTANFQKAIRKLYDLKEKAWAAGDAESIVTRFYSSDAISIGEGDPNTMVGREQFRKSYQQTVKDVPSVRIESIRSYVNGDAGWDWANIYGTVKPEKKSLYPPSPIRVLFLWARENGEWVCKGDVFVYGKFQNLP